MFLSPNNFSNLNSNCSNLSCMRNLQERIKKTFCYQKLFWPFTVWINCSSDLKIFLNSQPSASNFKSVSWVLVWRAHGPASCWTVLCDVPNFSVMFPINKPVDMVTTQSFPTSHLSHCFIHCFTRIYFIITKWENPAITSSL